MKVVTWVLGLVCAFSAQAASTKIVKCEGTYEGERESIRVRIDAETGEIVQWNKRKMADSKTSYLGGLAQDLEEYGYEWTSTIRTRTGVAILEMGTTADSFKLALSADRKRGSFEYRDIGSGAGNHRFELECK